MYIHDMVKIDDFVFKVVREGVNAPPPPSGSLTFSNTPDRIGLNSSEDESSKYCVINCLPPDR